MFLNIMSESLTTHDYRIWRAVAGRRHGAAAAGVPCRPPVRAPRAPRRAARLKRHGRPGLARRSQAGLA